MTHSERSKLREVYGLQYGTVCVIEQNVRQLQANGLTFKQVRKAVENLHPKVMANLHVARTGMITVKNKSLRWRRRGQWLSKWKRCFSCGVFLEIGEIRRRECARCLEYRRMCARWAREAKKR